MVQIQKAIECGEVWASTLIRKLPQHSRVWTETWMFGIDEIAETLQCTAVGACLVSDCRHANC